MGCGSHSCSKDPCPILGLLFGRQIWSSSRPIYRLRLLHRWGDSKHFRDWCRDAHRRSSDSWHWNWHASHHRRADGPGALSSCELLFASTSSRELITATSCRSRWDVPGCLLYRIYLLRLDMLRHDRMGPLVVLAITDFAPSNGISHYRNLHCLRSHGRVAPMACKCGQRRSGTSNVGKDARQWG